jgi:hypothetical protein
MRKLLADIAGSVPALVGGMRFEVWDNAPSRIEARHPDKAYFVTCGYAFDADDIRRETWIDVGFRSRAAASRWCRKNGACKVKHWYGI